MSSADPFDMLIIHSVFKRESRVLADVIHAVPEGDTARSAVVGAHLLLMLHVLEHHHVGEDEYLWPLLRQRAPDHEALFATMDSDHREVHAPLERARVLAVGWTASASSVEGETLAEELRSIANILVPHLESEETQILPLVQDHLTQEEWAVLGQRGVASVPQDKILMFLAAMSEDTPDAEWSRFFSQLPPPVQEAYTTVAVPGYPAYVGGVRGTA